MERIVIPGHATYAPLPLPEVFVGSRLLLGATFPGQVLAGATLGLYVGSALVDAYARRGVRPVDFQAAFGGDIDTHDVMPLDARKWEVQLLGHALNEGYCHEALPREEVARRVDAALVRLIAGLTGQEIITSTEIRSFSLASVVMPQAVGMCDPISGYVAIFRDLGMSEPHVVAHELAHRKGYLKELHAQLLAFVAQRTSGDPWLVQSARLERLRRQLAVIRRQDPVSQAPEELVGRAVLRRELHEGVLGMFGERATGRRAAIMRRFYDTRMKLTGQNGLSDYDEGFTNVLWTLSRTHSASLPASHAAI